MAAQALGLLLIGPSRLRSNLFTMSAAVTFRLLCAGLALSGIGQALSLTPMMADMLDVLASDRKPDTPPKVCPRATGTFMTIDMYCRFESDISELDPTPTPSPCPYCFQLPGKGISASDRAHSKESDLAKEDEAVEEISGLITACLSLGNVLGPLGGTVIASSLGIAYNK
ncbi:hypothetical protein T492DRAFT_837060 [Pavlovales sp. CCMP2436]|nr:hypothetical protein T492DRAFT_837060 [Pavlovales sp. CCMP2436]